MEDNKRNLIELENREMCRLEGVKKLDSFDDKEFLLDTNLGYLHIKGKKLSLDMMDMEKGELTIKGEIDSLTYIHSTSKKETNFFKKLFK